MKPDWEGFGKAIMERWPEGDVDGFELENIAKRYGVLVEEPGGYDPEKHGEDFVGDPEPGDTWYVRNYDMEASDDRS